LEIEFLVGVSFVGPAAHEGRIVFEFLGRRWP
jgi:hypothetical protein